MCEFLVKGSPLFFLCLEGCSLTLQIGVVVAGPTGEVAPVQLHDACGELPEEGAVVCHEEECRLHLEQEALEPEDRFEIEMIGRLIQQQHVGLAHQGACQQDAALQSAGEALEQLLRGESHLLHQILDADIGFPILLGSTDTQSCMDDLKNRSLDSFRNFLGQAGQHNAVRFGDLAFLRFFLTCNDAHDAGLAGAVTAHEADALARIDLQVDLIKQGAVGVAQGDAAELEERHVKTVKS